MSWVWHPQKEYPVDGNDAEFSILQSDPQLTDFFVLKCTVFRNG